MKNRLLTKKSVAALSLELHSVWQNHKPIEDFGKNIEDGKFDIGPSRW